jgi:hypothetical protein
MSGLLVFFCQTSLFDPKIILSGYFKTERVKDRELDKLTHGGDVKLCGNFLQNK